MTPTKTLLRLALSLLLVGCGGGRHSAGPPPYHLPEGTPQTCSLLADEIYHLGAQEIARLSWGRDPMGPTGGERRPGIYYTSEARDGRAVEGLILYDDGTGFHVHSLADTSWSRAPCVWISDIRMDGKAGAWTAMRGVRGWMTAGSSIKTVMKGEDIELQRGPLKEPERREGLARTVLLVRRALD